MDKKITPGRPPLQPLSSKEPIASEQERQSYESQVIASDEFTNYEKKFKALAKRTIENIDLTQEEKLTLYKWVQEPDNEELRKDRSTAVSWMDECFMGKEFDDELDLAGYCQAALPPFIEKMTWLRFLCLRSCSLIYFPASLCELTNLKELNLIDNIIETLPDEIFKLTDAVIFLKGNPIKKEWKKEAKQKIASLTEHPCLDYHSEPNPTLLSSSNDDFEEDIEEESEVVSSVEKEPVQTANQRASDGNPFLGVASTSKDQLATIEVCETELAKLGTGQSLSEHFRSLLRLRTPFTYGRIVELCSTYERLLHSIELTPDATFRQILLGIIYQCLNQAPILDDLFLNIILQRDLSGFELIRMIDIIENKFAMNEFLNKDHNVNNFIQVQLSQKRFNKMKELIEKKEGRENKKDVMMKLYYYKLYFREKFGFIKNSSDFLFTTFPKYSQLEHNNFLEELEATWLYKEDIFNLDEWQVRLAIHLAETNQEYSPNDKEFLNLKTEDILKQFHLNPLAQQASLQEQEPPAKRVRLS